MDDDLNDYFEDCKGLEDDVREIKREMRGERLRKVGSLKQLTLED